MIRINVYKSGSCVQFADFNFQSDADRWTNELATQFAWGKPQRTLVANEQNMVTDVDGSTPDLSKAISTGTTTDILGNSVNTYTFAAEYSITQADSTAILVAQQAIQKGLQAQQVGAQCVAQVYAFNEAKFAAGTLTPTDFQAILADTTLQTIERLLWNGSLATALSMIQSYTSPYFSSSDIASVAAIITNSGLV